jgi:hypothetical protein
MGLHSVKDKGERYIRRLAPLESPGIFAAIVDGPRPAHLTVTGFAKACRVHGRRKPVSTTHRTGLAHAETEIGKWRAETGAAKPPVLT